MQPPSLSTSRAPSSGSETKDQPLVATEPSKTPNSTPCLQLRAKRKPAWLSDAEASTPLKASTPKPRASSKPKQYVVKKFLDYRVLRGKHELLTQWASFSKDHASWIPLKNARSAPDALRCFCTLRKEACLPYPPTSFLTVPPPSPLTCPRTADQPLQSAPTPTPQAPPPHQDPSCPLVSQDQTPLAPHTPSAHLESRDQEPPLQNRKVKKTPKKTVTPQVPTIPSAPSDIKCGGTPATSTEPAVGFIVSDPPPCILHHFDSLPSLSMIMPLLVKSCREARQIPALPPPRWKEATTSAWQAEMSRLSSLIESSLLDPSPINLFNCVLSVLLAPSSVLGPLLKQPKTSAQVTSTDDTVNSAIRKILKGQEAKAFKLLGSNGVATVDEAAVSALRELHPQRVCDLKCPQASCDQLSVDRTQVSKDLFLAAADFSLSRDVFGWTPWLLFSVRGEKAGFFDSFVKLVCLLANSPKLFPPICGQILATGGLTPLHKLSADERKQRESLLLPPKLRPINSGTLLAKTALASVLLTPAAARATARLSPYQLAIGVPRGVEKLVHICRAAHASGWLVGRNDFANGFNSLCRQKMLDAHATLFPESVDVFNLFYGAESPILLFDRECNATILTSAEGPRQGCATGTHAFALTIHPLLAELKTKYPEFELRAITDDIIPLVPPPSDPSGWQALYRRYGSFLQDLRSLALRHGGLHLNMDKCGILLPPGAPQPDAETRKSFPTLFDFRFDGFRVAGSPIGTDAFVTSFVETKLLDSLRKLHAIKTVGYQCPRAAHRLLSTCVSKLLGFIAATVPPGLAMPALATFDDHLSAAFLHILAPTGFECSQERMDRAKLKVSLPSSHGCGLFRSADQGSIAWWSSVSSCLIDPLLFRLRDGLAEHVPAAWQCLTDALGGPASKFRTQAASFLPKSPESLLDGSQFSPMHPPVKIKLCKLFLRLCTRLRLDAYNELTSVKKLSPTLTKADVLHAHACTSAGRIFAEPLNTSLPFCFTNESYVSWCCFFLGLPPVNTLNNHVQECDFDYPIQKCQSIHSGTSPFLDVVGCHASSNCPSTYSARQRRHRYITQVIVNAAQEAGLSARAEPDTYNLLLGDFSQANCKRMFPRQASKLYKDRVLAVVNAVELVSSPSCAMTEAEKRAYVQKRIDDLPAVAKEDAVGLRIDVAIENKHTGETKWVDTTVVHTAAESYREREFKAVMARDISASTTSALAMVDPLRQQPSPLLIERSAAKKEKYSRLLWIAKKQSQQKKRMQAPSFAAFAVSGFGELSPSALELLDWIGDQHRRLCEQMGPRADGYKPLDMVRNFRLKLKTSVQMAIAAGSGEMLHAAGQPWGRSLIN
jgi:hypothetical protein